MRLTRAIILPVILASFASSPGLPRSPKGQETDDRLNERDSIAAQMQHVLDGEIERWYPLAVDTLYGGYFSDINADWKLDGRQDKFVVTQARNVWSTAKTARFYQKDSLLRSMAWHGFRFLRDKMWDQKYGGFYDLVDRKGEPLKDNGKIIKKAYGNAFAIYGLAAYYNTSRDTAALGLARRTFSWLESHSYDSLYGGYFQFMSREGVPFISGYGGAPPKDQNSSIHLLECFTELYRVWPDRLLRERLESILQKIRDTITNPKGYMTLFFRRDWSPVSFRDASEAERQRNYEFDHVSFGHDIETAYLMLEACEVLGMKNDSTTLRCAKRMVDHALANGWDTERGGIFDGGYYQKGKDRPSIIRRTKEWWSQAEALNSFLLMAELFPADEHRYFEKFRSQWDYCRKYLIDGERGSWYWGGVDIVPGNKDAPKGSIWKATYHTSRSMMNCIRRLRNRNAAYRDRSFEPVNPNATPEARKLLQFLYSIHGKHIIAGHHNYVGRIDTYPDRVNELTGKRPQIWGCDFIHYYRPGDSDTIVTEAYKKYKEGYIITLMWHAGRAQDDPPFGWKESMQAKLTDAEWKELTTPGTRLNARWMMQVDTIASYLGRLQALGVPVLWRPYHELNGVWFWWGNRKGADGSAKLWRMMFDRFVHYHKLNNLLWVWNTNAPRENAEDEAYAYKDYFPGLDVVDVLATDVYGRDYEQSHHDELVELSVGKLIALGEIGEVPTPEILKNQPMWTWFMIWGDFVNTHNTPDEMRLLYNDPVVLNHDDVLRIYDKGNALSK